MNIVFQHDHPLPVKKYGGIERIIYWQMVDLVRLGHCVTLIGHPDSIVGPAGIKLIPMKENWVAQVPKDTDLIHLYYNNIPTKDYPVLNTLQGNGKKGELFQKNTVFISKVHARNHGSNHYIYNAIDLEEYPFPEKENPLELENFMFLAKGSWSVKNLKDCVRAAKKSKHHLHIAGGKAILPSRFIHNHGMVGGEEKLTIMNNCDALLFPVRWHEPFGIAIIEAMAMGMPVIGSPYGSLPELIPKMAGHIVNNYQELLTTLQIKQK
ncbi:MAG: glycosyltransferase, partial [Halobacteriovoraceae bacterium]|nr:glycosyltransferase [Halobacteriovoraceae bacterium]